MGGWKLEVGKMALYMAFPVALFHYFNQPEYFEKWVTEVKRDIYPPENPQHRQDMMDAIRRINREYDEQHLLKESAKSNTA